VSTETLFAKVVGNPLLAGITLTGGEPFEQAAALVPLARMVRAKGLSIWAYSGYLFEELRAGIPGAAAAELLDEVNVLVDGKFEQELQTLDLLWRGSSNQRIIDVKASLRAGQAVLWEAR
jgi:anaerobic ribonucleoside-triphosphate reductase activating protein